MINYSKYVTVGSDALPVFNQFISAYSINNADVLIETLFYAGSQHSIRVLLVKTGTAAEQIALEVLDSASFDKSIN
jgi:hypothetical protein